MEVDYPNMTYLKITILVPDSKCVFYICRCYWVYYWY